MISGHFILPEEPIEILRTFEVAIPVDPGPLPGGSVTFGGSAASATPALPSPRRSVRLAVPFTGRIAGPSDPLERVDAPTPTLESARPQLHELEVRDRAVAVLTWREGARLRAVVIDEDGPHLPGASLTGVAEDGLPLLELLRHALAP